jgi:hypothetical protein
MPDRLLSRVEQAPDAERVANRDLNVISDAKSAARIQFRTLLEHPSDGVDGALFGS